MHSVAGVAEGRGLFRSVKGRSMAAGLMCGSGCESLLQVPQPAALFFNDCQHVAAQLLSLPYAYAPSLAQLAPSAPTHFIDAALRLRAAGSAVLDAQVPAPALSLSHASLSRTR